MRPRHHPLSLWKRAVLHGLNTLTRKHPGAALHATGATVAYAGREVAHEGVEFVKEKAEHLAHAREKAEPSEVDPSALLEKLSTEERRALSRLAPQNRR